jgi:hypothetical protein
MDEKSASAKIFIFFILLILLLLISIFLLWSSFSKINALLKNLFFIKPNA